MAELGYTSASLFCWRERVGHPGHLDCGMENGQLHPWGQVSISWRGCGCRQELLSFVVSPRDMGGCRVVWIPVVSPPSRSEWKGFCQLLGEAVHVPANLDSLLRGMGTP